MKHVSMRTLRCSQQEAWWPNKLRCKRKYTLKNTGEPVNTFWENDQGHEFWLIWGPKMDPKLDLGGSYSTHRWKYLQWACEAILMWRQWKPFEKATKVQNFYLLGFQNGPKIAPLKPESTSNEHIKQEWCESRGNFLMRYSKTWILSHW